MILVAISKLGQQQVSATLATNEAIEQLLDYVTTYPYDGITYHSSGMVLTRYYHAAYLNVNKSCI